MPGEQERDSNSISGAGAPAEGRVSCRVPVLGENNVAESRRDSMNDFDDGVAIGNGERAAWAEAVLYADDQEYVLGSNFHRFSPLRLRQMSLTPALPGSLRPDTQRGLRSGGWPTLHPATKVCAPSFPQSHRGKGGLPLTRSLCRGGVWKERAGHPPALCWVSVRHGPFGGKESDRTPFLGAELALFRQFREFPAPVSALFS